VSEVSLKVLLQTVRGIDKLGILYVIGGSFASSFHGLPRTTNDVDIVAGINEEQIKLFAAEFENDFYVDEDMIKRAVRQKSFFSMIHLDTAFKINIFIVNPGFQEKEIERRQLKKLGTDGNYSFYFSTPEDIVLAKLDWYHKGIGRAWQHWKDITIVIRIQGKRLDIDYMSYWAGKLQLSDLLEQALEESLID
jgi:hypothetical protein